MVLYYKMSIKYDLNISNIKVSVIIYIYNVNMQKNQSKYINILK